jgi:hypothetical protein
LHSPSNHPQGLGGCSTPPGCGPPPRATTSGAVRGECASVGQIFARLLASEVELILFNVDEKMKRGTSSPTPHAPTPKQQCPRCGGTWQRHLLCVATTTPQSRHDSVQGRRLLGVTLRHPSVGSRFPLKQPPGFPGSGIASVQGFLSRWSLEPMAMARRRLTVAISPVWLRPLSVLQQTGLDLRRKARGSSASTKEEPMNDRPSPRFVLFQTSTRPSAAPGCQAGFGSL